MSKLKKIVVNKDGRKHTIKNLSVNIFKPIIYQKNFITINDPSLDFQSIYKVPQHCVINVNVPGYIALKVLMKTTASDKNVLQLVKLKQVLTEPRISVLS